MNEKKKVKSKKLKWQQDKEFTYWLLAMEYLDEDGNKTMSTGPYLYMYEAWLASRGAIKTKKVAHAKKKKTIRRADVEERQ